MFTIVGCHILRLLLLLRAAALFRRAMFAFYAIAMRSRF